MNIPSLMWLVGSYAGQVVDRMKSFPDLAGISELSRVDPHLNILVIANASTNSLILVKMARRLNKAIAMIRSQVKCLKTIRSQVKFLEAMTACSPDICSSHRSAWTVVSDTCLEQVNQYAADGASRYCYLVSPIEIIV